MINIIGTIWGTQGYAIHSRNLARAIDNECGAKLTTDLIQGWETQVNDQELKMLKENGEYDTNIIIAQPNAWRMYTERNKTNIGFLVWEGDKIPKSWMKDCLNPEIDLIFVPSEHTRMAIENTVVDTKDLIATKQLMSKVHVIPHGVDPNLFKPGKKKTDIFTFLCNKGFRGLEDRGGIQYAIKAFIEEFKLGEAQMILKINPAYPMGDMNQHLKDLGVKEDSPKIGVCADNMKYEDLPNLYNDCDVFVAPTRAEAFNIPCLEALSCGKPVITSNFGGQIDFCNDKNGWIIGGELKTVEHELMYEEVKWLTPDITELRKAMREAFNDLGNKGNVARKDAVERTWENTAKKVAKIVQDQVGGDSG